MEALRPERELSGGQLILVPGRDPLRTSGGSESYVVAHGRAAVLAGYEPHVFVVGRRSGVLETDFGFLHRVGSPVLPPRSITSVLQRPWLVPAIVRLLERLDGTHVVHGFGAWADIAVASCRRLARHGVRAVPIATAYVPIEHETSPKLESAVVQQSLPLRARHRLELAWARRVTVPVER